MNGKQWSGVDQRHLAALEAIAVEGSFRAAADRLGYVQSAVSDQIAHLEQCVGMQLVRRQKGGASSLLTEPGERLLWHFAAISTRFAAAQAEMAELRDGRGRSLRIGVLDSVAEQLLAGTLVRFQRAEPEVGLEVVERRSAEELTALVAAAGADVAFGTLPVADSALRWRQLLRDPYVLLAPADWALAGAAGPAPLAELTGMPLIGADDSPPARLLEDELRAAGIEPDWVFRSARHGVVRALVAAGMGAALVPRTTVEAVDERIAVIEVEPALSPRTDVVFWRVDQAPDRSLDRFVELAAGRAAWLRDRHARESARRARRDAQPETVTLIG